MIKKRVMTLLKNHSASVCKSLLPRYILIGSILNLRCSLVSVLTNQLLAHYRLDITWLSRHEELTISTLGLALLQGNSLSLVLNTCDQKTLP
jgi:hypothetical protein